jgi:D-arabinose 1-dehydrogenase
MTKCGRFGVSDFDYSPARVRSSVENSLRRLQTDYLDAVYLHDVEFVCTRVTPRQSGNHLAALAHEKVEYGLAEGDEGKIRGDGDQTVLDAFAELRKLKNEGKVKHIGITGTFPTSYFNQSTE